MYVYYTRLAELSEQHKADLSWNFPGLLEAIADPNNVDFGWMSGITIATSHIILEFRGHPNLYLAAQSIAKPFTHPEVHRIRYHAGELDCEGLWIDLIEGWICTS